MMTVLTALPRIPHKAVAVLLAITCASISEAQDVSKTVLGHIPLHGPVSGGHIISSRGNQIAQREKIDGKERYVTLQGPGESFDRIYPGVVGFRIDWFTSPERAPKMFW